MAAAAAEPTPPLHPDHPYVRFGSGGGGAAAAAQSLFIAVVRLFTQCGPSPERPGAAKLPRQQQDVATGNSARIYCRSCQICHEAGQTKRTEKTRQGIPHLELPGGRLGEIGPAKKVVKFTL
eukprot:gene19357-biopygen17495